MPSQLEFAADRGLQALGEWTSARSPLPPFARATGLKPVRQRAAPIPPNSNTQTLPSASQPSTLTKRIGQGRNGAAVFAKEGGFEVEFGAWSHAKGRILNAYEEITAAKCRFHEANPQATHGQRIAFARAYKPFCGRFETEDFGALLAGLGRVVQRYDAIIILSLDVAHLGGDFEAVFGAGRVFLPPQMGLGRMSKLKENDEEC